MSVRKKKQPFEKEATEKDALNRILWDRHLDPSEYEIFYADRFSGRLNRVAFTDIRIVGDYFSRVDGLSDSLIPMHRIRRITQLGKTVWAKRKEA